MGILLKNQKKIIFISFLINSFFFNPLFFFFKKKLIFNEKKTFNLLNLLFSFKKNQNFLIIFYLNFFQIPIFLKN